MTHQLPDLDQLQVLDTIERTGSFSAAGRALNRATSAVSYAIKELESDLGLTLFDRSGHRAVLTAAGHLVLTEAREVLSRARHLAETARQLETGWEPRLAVVVDGILPQPPIMAALKALGAEEAPTRVQVMVEYLTGVSERFVSEDAELMLALEFPGAPELVSTPLPEVPVLLVTHPEHPLAWEKRVDRAHLTRHVELIVGDSGEVPSDRPHHLRFGSPHTVQLSDFHSKMDAIRSGVGFGWLPEHLCADDLSRGRMTTIDFLEGPRHVFRPQLVTRREAPEGPAQRRFVNALTWAWQQACG